MKRSKVLIPIIFICFFLSSCAQKQMSVRDLEVFPQDAYAYFAEDRLILSPEKQKKLAAEYLAFFFSPWTGEKPPIKRKNLTARYTGISKTRGLGENLQPLSPDFIRSLIDNTDLNAYPSGNIRGITTRALNLRVLPTKRPYFLEKCGPDSYPFDLFQKSVLWSGTPLILRHHTRDRQWVYVEAGFVAGWIEVHEFARVDEKLIDIFTHASQITLIEDHVPLFSAQGEFIADGRIGMILPAQNGQVLFPVSNGTTAKLETAQVSAASITPFPLGMTRFSAAGIVDGLKGQPYGWGGLYENRDCSSMLRDYFTVFGVWLPRNSFAQIQRGKVQDLSGLGLDAKKKLLLEEAVPFIHMVGRKGHVTLYVGTHGGEPVFFHAMWGVPVKSSVGGKEKRIIIGRSAFTGPSPGHENPEARKAGKSLLGIMDFLTDPTWREEEIAP